ncbi:hypothetical protein [Paracidovorax avenae]|uniref:hypothetical protein n=1 Tax=Paracidovorax avenae TaxID=80867 RepID=UPI000D162766|nr:hypothetical protein [Paracidovorax avenae]AVS89708.1 hypothetical protein C8238_16900 [Paracidovorax avenae]AVS96735.1 hypothetical protein C8232_11100 [Paracidovorax avenae]AVT03842.1 hypothetical protein C8243_16060 [Paracidovorax avenae]AVT10758.1 hypothetical protein C8242_15635 [Paracidovorax avenae]
MPSWTPFPHAGEYAFTTGDVLREWERLHRGDAEPIPRDAAALEAWTLFHCGNFEEAARVGLAAGGAGITAANKATIVHAVYLEPSESRRLELLGAAAQRARVQADAEPGNPNAWFWHAYALGRYSQGISVAKALALGLTRQVRTALDRTIALSERHADARLALAVFHAEVIDKVGEMVGSITHGARREESLRLFAESFALNPHSVIGRIEHANALLMLDGAKQEDLATKLYEEAAGTEAADAAERLAVELARLELAEG